MGLVTGNLTDFWPRHVRLKMNFNEKTDDVTKLGLTLSQASVPAGKKLPMHPCTRTMPTN